MAEPAISRLFGKKKGTDHAQLTVSEVRGLVNQILVNLGGETGREWFDVYNRANRRENPWPETAVDAPLLKRLGEAAIAVVMSRFNPRIYFTTRKGLRIHNMTSVLDDAKPGLTANTATILYFELERDALDHQIKSALPKEYEVELWQIATLINLQSEGAPGALRTDGKFNVFYVHGLCVTVNWNAEFREWYVFGWKLRDTNNRGCSIFSRK